MQFILDPLFTSTVYLIYIYSNMDKMIVVFIFVASLLFVQFNKLAYLIKTIHLKVWNFSDNYLLFSETHTKHLWVLIFHYETSYIQEIASLDIVRTVKL